MLPNSLSSSSTLLFAQDSSILSFLHLSEYSITRFQSLNINSDFFWILCGQPEVIEKKPGKIPLALILKRAVSKLSSCFHGMLAFLSQWDITKLIGKEI